MTATRSPAAEPGAVGDLSAPAYVVLARRYRPGQLEEVIGQGHVTRTLTNAIGTSRVHHAYLFTGSRGVGKTTVARILAKALNCDEGSSAKPCDRCTSCTEIRDGRSVDVYEIDGASHTGVDDVRELRESVRYLPARCRHKIYIIDEVHMLSTSAFNALLKTLEEPPAHVVFIFATTEPHKIPATILSRCQRFDFKRVPQPLLVGHLSRICAKEGVQVQPEGLTTLARAAEGSVRDALSLLDQIIAFDSTGQTITAQRVAEVLGVADRRVLFDLSRTVLKRDTAGSLAILEQVFSSGQDLSQFAVAFLGHLRDLTVARTCSAPDGSLLDATEAELKELKELAAQPEGALLPQLFDRFARAGAEIARSTFPRLLFEMALIEMAQAELLLPLGDLLERLEQLESRLGGRSSAPPGAAPGSPPRFPSSQRSAPRRSPTGHAGPKAAPAGAGPGPGPTAPLSGAGSEEPGPGPALSGAGSEEPGVGPAPRPDAMAETANADTNPGAGLSPLQVPPRNGTSMEVWKQVLQRVEHVQPVAAGAYFSGRLLSWSGHTIRLGYPAGSFELSLARRTDKLQAFVDECRRQTKSDLNVEICEIDPQIAGQGNAETMSAMEEQALRAAERARSLEQEARSHPITQALVKELGATIDTITTEADES